MDREKDAAAGGDGGRAGVLATLSTTPQYIPGGPAGKHVEYRATDSIQLMRALARVFGGTGFDSTLIVARAQHDGMLRAAIGFMRPERMRPHAGTPAVRRWLRTMLAEGRLRVDARGWVHLLPGGAP